jgi:hypothetical protein
MMIIFLSPLKAQNASPHEGKLVEATIDNSFTEYASDRLVADKAYISLCSSEVASNQTGNDINGN